MSKTLLVVYSHSGVTESVAQLYANQTDTTTNRIDYAQQKKFSRVRAIRESIKHEIHPIIGDLDNPAEFEHVILFTPIWARSCATPIRSYLRKYEMQIKRYSIVTTSLFSDASTCAKELTQMIWQEPELIRSIRKKEWEQNKFEPEWPNTADA